MKKVKCFLAVLMLSSVMLLGCGDSAEKVESDSDQCVVVQVPDGSTVEELFTFKQKTQMALSYLEDDSTTVYRIGDLEEGGSIVWGANDAFLYVPGGQTTAISFIIKIGYKIHLFHMKILKNLNKI